MHTVTDVLFSLIIPITVVLALAVDVVVVIGWTRGRWR
jgi:hypothetical protein